MDDNPTTGLRVSLLDMGDEKYGDCILCQSGETTVLIDGGHVKDIAPRGSTPSIPQQLREILGQEGDDSTPLKVSLLVVTHCHSDHIGCLPELIGQNILQPEWALVIDEDLGFGRPTGSDAPPVDESSSLAHRVAAALREENHDDLPADQLQDFIDTAANVESRYRKMVAMLADKLGPQLVRYTGKRPAAVEQAFAAIGLSVFGPSEKQLLLCTQAISQHAHDAADMVQQMIASQSPDARPMDAAALYRSLAGSPFSDAADSTSGGAMFNNQSIVFKLECGQVKVLLTGDMQLANSEMGGGVTAEIKKLRAAVAADARTKPFDFVKMAHHAATNGFNSAIYKEWNSSVRYGISGGRQDSKHPSPVVLKLLAQLRKADPDVEWARTDRNGLIVFGPAGDELKVARGEVDDASAPNAADEAALAAGVSGVPPAPPLPPPPPGPAAGGAAAPARGVAAVAVGKAPLAADQAQISASFPYHGSRVTLSINLEPLGAEGGKEDLPPVTPPPPPTAGLLGGGRRLPKLLFVTSRDALRQNLGTLEADAFLKRITDAGQPLLDSLPAGGTEPTELLGLVRAKTAADVRGVVLVGGYDVVPAHRLDTLDAALRKAVRARGRDGIDPFDDYIVWSDAAYGDRDGDGMSELPVSRIPDAKTPALVDKMLSAGSAAQTGPGGVRNVHREYAAVIYQAMPGASPDRLLVSEPSAPGNPRYAGGVLTAPMVYLMLHGDYNDTQRLWGEDSNDCSFEAANVGDVPGAFNGVVFCGACWGALTVKQLASSMAAKQLPVPLVAGASMALKYLEAGALAFVGCTGSHYSPEGRATNYYGGPMHSAFWSYYTKGAAPAEALYKAKTDYIAGIPHRGTTDPVDKARELKILREFTCLGLGW